MSLLRWVPADVHPLGLMGLLKVGGVAAGVALAVTQPREEPA
jgi:hypothetical protein